MLRVALDGPRRGVLLGADFLPLPARPMVDLVINPQASRSAIRSNLAQRLSREDPNAIVRIHHQGDWTAEAGNALSAAILRSLGPSTMNISLARACQR